MLKLKFPKCWGHRFILLTSEIMTLTKPLHSRAPLLTASSIVGATTLAFHSLSTLWEPKPFYSLNSSLPRETHTKPPLLTTTSIIGGVGQPHFSVHFSAFENRNYATHTGSNFSASLLCCFFVLICIIFFFTKRLKVEIINCYHLWLFLCLSVMNCYDWVQICVADAINFNLASFSSHDNMHSSVDF